jgi:hypothetical protein
MMENKDTYLKSILNSDNLTAQSEVWYKAYGIVFERVELYYDFLNSLHILIDDTYLGSDVLINEEDQKNHFTWCWEKTIDNLSKERIYLKKRGYHYEYFWEFFLESYYYPQMDESEVKIGEYIYKLFDYNHSKTRSELGVLTEIYKLLDKNLTLKT